ncbi:MAG: hypothetical protein L3J65_08300 [Robiginitomaculum sp.]|nr:hypothetical protein [Robiginitomaculum sp.]
MSIARIIWIVSLLAAVVLAFVTLGKDGSTGALILTVLGIASGWFVDKEHRLGLLVAAIFLMSGGYKAWGGIPEVGGYLTDILGSIKMVLAAAGVTAVLRRLVERILLGKGTES